MVSGGVTTRLSQRDAERRYWPYLLLIPVLITLWIFVPSILDNWDVFRLALGASYVPSVWLSIFGPAPKSFWLFTLAYGLVGYMLAASLKAAAFLLTVGA